MLTLYPQWALLHVMGHETIPGEVWNDNGLIAITIPAHRHAGQPIPETTRTYGRGAIHHIEPTTEADVRVRLSRVALPTPEQRTIAEARRYYRGERPVRLYVASSWRNPHQPAVVERLRAAGFEVYDFRAPGEDADLPEGFGWREIDGGWQDWTPQQFRDALEHPLAQAGFRQDMNALMRSDACVLVLPCGRSAHLELGQAVGNGKRTCVLLDEASEPELMYKMCDRLVVGLDELVQALHDDAAYF